MTRPLPTARLRCDGFTLVEAIIVIVITGIIAAMVAVFIRPVFDSYFDTVRRGELTDEADVALRRLARDVRLALPNSLRVASSGGRHYIEFIMTSDGGRYRDPSDGSSDPTPATPPDCDSSPTPANGPCFLDFATAANTSFDVLGRMPALATGASGDYIVVYNLGPGYAPADAYQGGNRAQVSAVNGNTVTLAANAFASQTPPLPSPNSRFQVVPYAQRAVTYSCPTAAKGQMTRQWGYGFNASQATPPAGGSSATLLGNPDCTQKPCVTCEVDYAPNILQRNGLLYVKINVVDRTGEQVSVFQQIHVDNSP